jgi:hypothetical protein
MNLLKKTQQELSIHANLPCFDCEKGEYVELDYSNSLIINLSEFMKDDSSSHQIESIYFEFLGSLHKLSKIIFDGIDKGSNKDGNQILNKIFSLISKINSDLFLLYQQNVRNSNMVGSINSAKTFMLEFIIISINVAVSFVFSGENNAYYWQDITDLILTTIDENNIVISAELYDRLYQFQ